jgi:hypothetical protein
MGSDSVDRPLLAMMWLRIWGWLQCCNVFYLTVKRNCYDTRNAAIYIDARTSPVTPYSGFLCQLQNSA